MDSAKVFMTGRSQAVRLPKAYRFDASEVLIEKLADGSVVLRPKPTEGLGTRLWKLLEGVLDDATFERPPQPPLERDAAWWDAQIAAAEAEAARPSRRKRSGPAAK